MQPIISLNAVIPRYFDSTSISLVVMKSYLLDQLEQRNSAPRMDIRIDRFFCEEDSATIIDAICSQQPPLIGFSVYPWNYLKVKELVNGVKAKLHGTLIVLGGPSVSFEPKKEMEAWTDADVIVKGPGEETFLQLLTAWIEMRDFSSLHNLVFRKGDQILETSYEKNFSVEEQLYPLLIDDMQGYHVANYDTSRGCYFNCGYCGWNVDGMEPPGVHNYPITKVKKDLDNIFSLASLERLILNDSNITFDESRGVEVFQYIRFLNRKRQQNGLKTVRPTLDFNPQYLTDRIIDEIAGLHVGVVGFGLQSTDEEVLRLANRKFDKEKYIENLKKISRRGVQFIMELIFGLPGDTLEKFKASIEFVLSDIRTHSLMCFRFGLLPGSAFWHEKEKYLIVHKDHPPYHVISTSTFSEEELNYADRLSCWFDIFYSVFRSVKKTIEDRCIEKQLAMVPVYEEIFDRLSIKYGCFFDKGFKQDVSFHYFEKLREKGNRSVRHDIAADARKILKEIL